MAVLKYKDPDTGDFIGLGMYGVDSGAPVGASTYFHGTVIPTGWVVCDGTPHNSPPLERVIGSPNTPDLQDKFLLSAGPTYPPGSEGGAATHTLIEAEMPSHTHGTRRGGGGTEYAVHSTTEMSGGWSDLPTDAKGGGAAHNNMPPYYVLAYIQRKV